MPLISSRQNPVVRAFRTLARDADPDGSRLLLDGVHLIRDACDAGVELEMVAVSAGRGSGTEEAELARSLQTRGTQVIAATAQAFGAMTPVRAPSGIVAIARRTPTGLETICAHPHAFVIVAVDVQDPGNVGALIRSAEAAGATGVVVCGASANPFSWKAVRGSMGSILRLPVAARSDVATALRGFRQAGGHVVAAVARGGQTPDEIDWRGRVAIVVGGEGPGLAEDALAQADALVTIPMAPPVESLNVAVAAAVLVYAARRQRQAP
ncbi:MAG: hypothetical protein A3F70_13900 [Acidobacteria bacterium RIFCSPLOWO2_12_FULL_67_14]|nr:MAG: hypothetical protein A3F70_13900 [Acidobacteria bacterium RIFCSPLOWO2_12_FULL_67_14]